MTERQTKRVRAWNLKPGDVVELFDASKARPVKATVREVAPSPECDGHVIIRYRRWRNWAMLVKRTMLMRVRRLEKP